MNIVNDRTTDALTQAEEALSALLAADGAGPARPCRFVEFFDDPAFGADDADVLELGIEFGSARLDARELQALRAGAAVTLDDSAGDAVNLGVGGRWIGRGEPVEVDGKIGVRVTELFARNEAAA